MARQTSGGPIIVTGATGNVGREVVRVLAARGVHVRAAVRSVVTGGGPLEGLEVERVLFDFTRPETFGPAVRGARGLFLLRPPAIARVERTLNALVDVAEREGVEHAVFLSVIGAERNRLVPHHGVEQHLRASKLAWTFLRAGFFAQNLGDAYREDIRAQARLFVPAGNGRVAFVDGRDLAEVAALAFSDRANWNQAWTLTGAEALDFDEVAALLTEALGRTIRHERPGALSYLFHLRRRGMSWGQAAVITALHVGLRFGRGALVDPTLPRLLGRTPRTLRSYIQDHVALWRAPVLQEGGTRC